MATIADARRLVELDHGLAHFSTLRTDLTVQATVVNAGVVEHPLTGEAVGALVSRPGTLKLRHLRANPRATLCWRAGWAWCTVEGVVELIGPDEAPAAFDLDQLSGLLRKIYSAAGGAEHPDWAEFDREMATERRVAVLVRPTRIYVNP